VSGPAFYDRESGHLIPADATEAEEAVIRGERSISGGQLGVRMGTECQCHSHRENVPIERHHVWPLGMGGPEEDGNIVKVCANAHHSIHAFLDHLVKTGGDPDPTLAKMYGWKVRRLARRGYDRWKASR